jgi:hypothetical protein
VTYQYRFAGQTYEGRRITAMDSAETEQSVRLIVNSLALVIGTLGMIWAVRSKNVDFRSIPKAFQGIDGWAPLLADALRICIPVFVATRINAAQPRCVEDALEMLFELVDRDRVIYAALTWIRSTSVFGYHGSKRCGA